MAQSPLLVVAAVKTARRHAARIRFICENRGRAEYGKPGSRKGALPDESRHDLPAILARSKQDSTHCWVNCALAQIIWCAASSNIIKQLTPTDAGRPAPDRR
jgi:hypothetical protein